MTVIEFNLIASEYVPPQNIGYKFETKPILFKMESCCRIYLVIIIVVEYALKLPVDVRTDVRCITGLL